MAATADNHSWRGSGIERASPADRAFLAMDTGKFREQFGVLLMLDPAPGFDVVCNVIAERIAAVPRLRQKLVRVPLGCGGPIWVMTRV